MPPRDRYLHFAELAFHEQIGLDFNVRAVLRTSRVAVLAPHGGGIEPGTSELAAAIAGKIFSLYIFEGRKRGGSRSLHITSTRFDEPRCLELLAKTDIAVTIHGCEGSEPVVFTGGMDQRLQGQVIQELLANGFNAFPDSPARAGEHPDNLCNRGKSGQGLQLEISEGLRKQFFASLDRRGRRTSTLQFARFTDTLQAALLNYLDEFMG